MLVDLQRAVRQSLASVQRAWDRFDNLEEDKRTIPMMYEMVYTRTNVGYNNLMKYAKHLEELALPEDQRILK